MDELVFCFFFLICFMKNGIYVSVLLLSGLVGWMDGWRERWLIVSV